MRRGEEGRRRERALEGTSAGMRSSRSTSTSNVRPAGKGVKWGVGLGVLVWGGDTLLTGGSADTGGDGVMGTCTATATGWDGFGVTVASTGTGAGAGGADTGATGTGATTGAGNGTGSASTRALVGVVLTLSGGRRFRGVSRGVGAAAGVMTGTGTRAGTGGVTDGANPCAKSDATMSSSSNVNTLRLEGVGLPVECV